MIGTTLLASLSVGRLLALDPARDRQELALLGGCGLGRQVEDAEARLGRLDVDIGVVTRPRNMMFKRRHEPLERRIDRLVVAHAVRDDGDPDVAEPDVADEQELLDEIRRRVHVDRRRRDGNQDRLRARQEILQQQARRPRRRIDDELARLARYHAPAIREPAADAAREVGAVDLARFAAALREPVQARALRIEVGDRRRDVASREVAGEIRRDRALADAALGVDHQRRVHRHLAAFPAPRKSRPAYVKG